MFQVSDIWRGQDNEKSGPRNGPEGGSRAMPVRAVCKDGAAMAYADDGAGAPFCWCTAGPPTAASSAICAGQLAKTPSRPHPHTARPSRLRTRQRAAHHRNAGRRYRDFFDALDLKRVNALGWSMGAMALWAAAPRSARGSAGSSSKTWRRASSTTRRGAHGLAGGYSADDVAATLERNQRRLAGLRRALRAAHVSRRQSRAARPEL